MAGRFNGHRHLDAEPGAGSGVASVDDGAGGRGRSLSFGTRCLNELEGSMLLAFPNLADILQDFVRSG